MLIQFQYLYTVKFCYAQKEEIQHFCTSLLTRITPLIVILSLPQVYVQNGVFLPDVIQKSNPENYSTSENSSLT